MIQQIQEVFWLISADRQQLLYLSPAFETIWGRSLESLYTYPGGYLNLLLDSIHPSDRERVIETTTHQFQGEYKAEYRIVRPDGSIRWVRSRSFPIQNQSGETWGIAGFSEDITERKQSEEILHQRDQEFRVLVEHSPDLVARFERELRHIDELEKKIAERTAELVEVNTLLKQEIAERQRAQEALKESHDFLQTILDTNPNLIFVKNSQGKVILANLAFVDFYGTTVADMLGLTAAQMHSNSAEVEQFLAQDQEVFASRQQKFIPEEAWCTPTGEVRWFQKIKTPLLDRDGQVHHLLIVCTDITKRKLAEARIKESLQEKEVLLQEIHHRVKNNLQVISSLLDLQSQYIEQPATIEVFRESCNRVKSMALVHEKLYESEDFVKINFAEYVENLTSYLFQVYTVKSDNITLEIDIDDVTLNIDTAIPCGLIINELVSNALKYAFPNMTNGIIKVALYSRFENKFTLIVKDNGIGFPSTFKLNNIKFLGIQLVKILTNQIGGILELDCSSGTEFRLNF